MPDLKRVCTFVQPHLSCLFWHPALTFLPVELWRFLRILMAVNVLKWFIFSFFFNETIRSPHLSVCLALAFSLSLSLSVCLSLQCVQAAWSLRAAGTASVATAYAGRESVIVPPASKETLARCARRDVTAPTAQVWCSCHTPCVSTAPAGNI